MRNISLRHESETFIFYRVASLSHFSTYYVLSLYLSSKAFPFAALSCTYFECLTLFPIRHSHFFRLLLVFLARFPVFSIFSLFFASLYLAVLFAINRFFCVVAFCARFTQPRFFHLIAFLCERLFILLLLCRQRLLMLSVFFSFIPFAMVWMFHSPHTIRLMDEHLESIVCLCSSSKDRRIKTLYPNEEYHMEYTILTMIFCMPRVCV